VKIVFDFGGVLGVVGNPLTSQVLQSLFHSCQRKGVKDIDFLVDFVVVNSNKLQKLSFQGKIS